MLALNSSSQPVGGTTVTISISSGKLNGTLSALTNASGLAIFSTLTENIAGNLHADGGEGIGHHAVGSVHDLAGGRETHVCDAAEQHPRGNDPEPGHCEGSR